MVVKNGLKKAITAVENAARLEEVKRLKDHLQFVELGDKVSVSNSVNYEYLIHLGARLEILSDLIQHFDRRISELKGLLK